MTINKEIFPFQELEEEIKQYKKIRKSSKEYVKFKKKISYMKGKLVEENSKLIYFYIRKHPRFLTTLEEADLIQEGRIGLMRAIEKFEWQKGYKFSTYAIWWIRQSISKAIACQERDIRIPTQALNSISKVKRLEKTNGHLTKEQIATTFEISDRRAKTIRNAIDLEPTISLDCASSNSIPIIESIDNGESLSDDLEQDNLLDYIRLSLDILTPVEKEIIRRRFSLDGQKPMNLRELGVVHGVSRERIRQLETRALDKIKNFCKQKLR